MGNCKDCKHWMPEGTLVREDGLGGCFKVIDRSPNQKAFILGNDFEATLSTRADFGCVLFEPK